MNKNVKLEKWQAAQKRHRLSDKQVQMGRELGLNPDKLGKIDNHKHYHNFNIIETLSVKWQKDR
jgi:hypothetical protein